MIVSLDKRVVSDLTSLSSRYNKKNINISIDSSKTNTAIWIMNKNYKGIELIEIDGSSDKDILLLIKEQRDFLKILFSNCTINDGGIEDIITKKDEESGGKYSEGLKHHHSRYVITAVFISIISFFQDNCNITLTPIPNQAWKSMVLPSHLNKRDVYKGSVSYIRDKYPQYITGNKDDDGSDAICIGEYMKMRSGLNKDSLLEEIPNEEEFIVNPCKYRLYNNNVKVKDGVQFEYNSNITLDMNARAIANRIQKGKLGYAVLNIDNISIEDVYSLCVGTFEEKVTHLTLIVKRV